MDDPAEVSAYLMDRWQIIYEFERAVQDRTEMSARSVVYWIQTDSLPKSVQGKLDDVIERLETLEDDDPYWDCWRSSSVGGF